MQKSHQDPNYWSRESMNEKTHQLPSAAEEILIPAVLPQHSKNRGELSDKLVLTPAGGSTFAIFNPTHGKYLQIDAVGTGCLVSSATFPVVFPTFKNVGMVLEPISPKLFMFVANSACQGCVSYGHRVVIAQSSDAGKNQCGWYGCRVGDMINNKMYFGHGGVSAQLQPPATSLNPGSIPPVFKGSLVRKNPSYGRMSQLSHHHGVHGIAYNRRSCIAYNHGICIAYTAIMALGQDHV